MDREFRRHFLPFAYAQNTFCLYAKYLAPIAKMNGIYFEWRHTIGIVSAWFLIDIAVIIYLVISILDGMTAQSAMFY